MCYIKNAPYQYPPDNTDQIDHVTTFNTGWHCIPTMLWRHFCTPKRWYELQQQFEAYELKGYKVTIFNMIPMTYQLAIQGNTAFTAFNNCVYALGYQDRYYETPWMRWLDTANDPHYNNLLYKEGQIYKYNSNSKVRYLWPTYSWDLPNAYTSTDQTWSMNNTAKSGIGVWPQRGKHPSGLIWDPLNEPESLMELRPGKNAITFTWEQHPCDEGKFYNFDQLASWFPWGATGPYNARLRPQSWKETVMDDPNELSTLWQENPGVRDYTVPNMAFQPLTPMAWFWKEMQQSIIEPDKGSTGQADFWRRTNLHWPGTEWEQYKYPPTQCFIKVIPMFDDNNTLIDCTAQISVKLEIYGLGKKRRSAIYAPTYGPFPWRSLYSAKTQDLNFMPSFIRVRTGGGRRTWQNQAFEINGSDTQQSTGHWRLLPYTYNENRTDNFWPTDAGGHGTTFTTTTTTADANRDLVVTFSKDSERVVIQRQEEHMDTSTERPTRPPKPQRRTLSPGLNIHTVPGNITHPHS